MNSRFIIIFLFITLNVNKVVSQSYVPFPTDSAYWRIDFTSNFQPTEMYQYLIDGDTVINSITYKKLGRSGDSGVYPYPGAFRDDTSARMVYFVAPDSSNEVVWFDFNLNVGDTIRGYFENGWNTRITSVDTIIFGGKARKRLQFNAVNMHPYFVEGIGNLSGMLDPIDHLDFSFVLFCFVQNGVTIYPDSTSQCMLVDKVNEQDVSMNIRISKNPFLDFTTITHLEKLIESIQLYDYLGKEILKKNVSNHSLQLSIDETGKGFLFCKINFLNERSFTVKLVSQ